MATGEVGLLEGDVWEPEVFMYPPLEAGGDQWEVAHDAEYIEGMHKPKGMGLLGNPALEFGQTGNPAQDPYWPQEADDTDNSPNALSWGGNTPMNGHVGIPVSGTPSGSRILVNGTAMHGHAGVTQGHPASSPQGQHGQIVPYNLDSPAGHGISDPPGAFGGTQHSTGPQGYAGMGSQGYGHGVDF